MAPLLKNDWLMVIYLGTRDSRMQAFMMGQDLCRNGIVDVKKKMPVRLFSGSAFIDIDKRP